MRVAGSVLLIGLTASVTAAPQILIQTRLEPNSDFRAGQPISYEIDVLTETWLTGTPEFATLALSNALVEFEGSQGRSIQREINGQRYFGVTYSYRLVPLESGVITLPGFTLPTPVGQAEAPVIATVPQLSFPVRPLTTPGTANVTLLAGDVQLTQTLSSDETPIPAGRPFIREVRVVADRALPLAIPAVSAPGADKLAGTRLPADVTVLKDGRGRITGGQRIERIRYLPEQAGTIILPSLVLTWWDIDESRVKNMTLPAIEVKVASRGQQATPLTTRLWESVAAATYWIESQKPALLLGILMFASVLAWTVWCYGHSVAGFFGRKVITPWRRSKIRMRFLALHQLRRRPYSLGGIFRIVRCVDGKPTIREASMDSQSRKELLQCLDQYYGRTPNQRLGYKHARRALRRLPVARTVKVRSHRYALKPLAPLNQTKVDIQ